MQSDHFQLSAEDGLSLHGCIWTPDAETRSIICVVHGPGDHIGRYENFAAFMTARGYAVIGIDLRGHGKSKGKRGYVRSLDILRSDVGNLLIEARKMYLDLPIFLFGHSLGGNIVTSYVIKQKSSELAGVIISSPMFLPVFIPPKWKISLSNILYGFIPGITLSVMIDPMELSGDPEIGRSYHDDPLVLDRISYSMLKIGIESGPWAIKNASLLTIPALVYHGNMDKITSLRGSLDFAANGGTNIICKIWENLKHETHNEKCRQEILNYVDQWISEVLYNKPDNN